MNEDHPKPGTPRHLRESPYVVIQRTRPSQIGPITPTEYVGMAILAGLVIGAMVRLAVLILS